jgi:hypothetical protein
VYDGDGHGIDVTHALEIFRDQALAHGAAIQSGEEVDAIDRSQKLVRTKGGQQYNYSKLVLASGPWTNRVLQLASLPLLPLFVSNEQLIYLRVPDNQEEAYASGHTNAACPIVGSFVQVDGRDGFCFMVPHFAGVTGKSMPINNTSCVKVAVHQQGELMETENFVLKPGASTCDFMDSAFHRRTIVKSQLTSCDWWQQSVCKSFVEEHLPDLDIEQVEIFYRCLYTNTADNHFVVGDLPTDSNVFVATGFHGEGFKFAPSIGEIVAQILNDEPVNPLVKACFSPHRFFLAEKVHAAFASSADRSMSRAMAKAVLKTVYGDQLEWDDMKQISEAIGDGTDSISQDEFLQSVLPSVESDRLKKNQHASLGPMQRARVGIQSKALQASVVTAKQAKRAAGCTIKVVCVLLYVSYILVGMVAMVSTWIIDSVDSDGVTVLSVFVVFISLLVATVGAVGMTSITQEWITALLAVESFNIALCIALVYSQAAIDLSSCDEDVRITLVILSVAILCAGACTMATWAVINQIGFKKDRKIIDLRRLDCVETRQAVKLNRAALESILDSPDDNYEPAQSFPDIDELFGSIQTPDGAKFVNPVHSWSDEEEDSSVPSLFDDELEARKLSPVFEMASPKEDSVPKSAPKVD